MYEVIQASPVKVPSAGGTLVRKLLPLQCAETLGTRHVNHSQQAHVPRSGVERCDSARQGDTRSDSVPIINIFWRRTSMRAWRYIRATVSIDSSTVCLLLCVVRSVCLKTQLFQVLAVACTIFLQPCA